MVHHRFDEKPDVGPRVPGVHVLYDRRLDMSPAEAEAEAAAKAAAAAAGAGPPPAEVSLDVVLVPGVKHDTDRLRFFWEDSVRSHRASPRTYTRILTVERFDSS